MSKRKLRPADCRDVATAELLQEQGIGFNDESIHIVPNSVILKLGHTTVRMSMKRFEMFAKWYLEEQEIKE